MFDFIQWKERNLAQEKRAGARSSVCTFNLCHITKILKNMCLIMNFICCSMNQHSNTCLIRHHYPISHAQYLTHTESLKIHIRCSTLLTVATIVWQRSN